jgi:hypothetical protein
MLSYQEVLVYSYRPPARIGLGLTIGLSLAVLVVNAYATTGNRRGIRGVQVLTVCPRIRSNFG